MSLNEFVHYLQDHERNLLLQFSAIDKNQDGKIHLEDMVTSFEELGIKMDYNEAVKLFNRSVLVTPAPFFQGLINNIHIKLHFLPQYFSATEWIRMAVSVLASRNGETF